MRLVTFETGPRQQRIGAVTSDHHIVDLNLAYAHFLRDVENEADPYRVADARVPADMRGFFEGGDRSLEAARKALAHMQKMGGSAKGLSGETVVFAADSVKLRAPIQPKKFFHTAGNFREHHEEAQKAGFSHPVMPWIVFFQNVDAIIGTDEPVVYPEHLTEELDYELELAVVIKKAGKHFSAAESGDFLERGARRRNGGQPGKSAMSDVLKNANQNGVWVSELNLRSEVRPPLRAAQPIRFYDTTLRDGEQTVGVVLDPQQKLEIARGLDGLGVSRIEAGFPRVSADDTEAFRLILAANLKAEIWGFARCAKADIDELIRLGVRSSVLEIPASDIKLRAYGLTREEAVRRTTDAVSLARKSGIRVAFFAVDGSRAALDFLRT